MIGAANDITLNRITANCRSHIFIPTGTWNCNNDSCDVTHRKWPGETGVGKGFWAWVAGRDASGFQTATYYFGEGFCMHSPDTGYENRGAGFAGAVSSSEEVAVNCRHVRKAVWGMTSDEVLNG